MKSSCSSVSSRSLLGAFMLSSLSCQSAEDTFANNRINLMCDQAYAICDVTAGCLLDEDHYIEGVFPGTHRLVIETEEDVTPVRLLLFLSEMEAPGTELLVQVYQPNCAMDSATGREHLENVDIFDVAGNDRTIIIELDAIGKGEHLVELFSDARARYMLAVEAVQ